MCKEMQSYTKERLQNLSEEEFFNLIAPLWAMRMWGNKKYYLDNVIESNGIDLIREQLVNLFYGKASIENRWDEFREKIKGLGPAIISELLNKFNPNEFILWNKKSLTGFIALGIPKVPKYNSALDGKKYAYLSKVGRELVESAERRNSEDERALEELAKEQGEWLDEVLVRMIGDRVVRKQKTEPHSEFRFFLR